MIRRVLIACAGVASVVLAIACAGEREPDPGVGADTDTGGRSVTSLPEANGRNLPTLGEPLLIALAQARNYHHKADIYLQQGKLDDAIASVRSILTVAFPNDAPEAEDVKLDARARLAKLLVARGRVDEAMTVVDDGIARSTRQSFFLANLYTVKGEVDEARANLLDDDDTDQARNQAIAARRDAIEAFDRSITINTELQKSLMNESAE